MLLETNNIKYVNKLYILGITTNRFEIQEERETTRVEALAVET